MIRAIGEVKNPAAIEMALTISMPIGEWEEVSKQLSAKYPGWDLSTLINRAVRKFTEQFNERVELSHL